jgi:hypothetical protein
MWISSRPLVHLQSVEHDMPEYSNLKTGRRRATAASWRRRGEGLLVWDFPIGLRSVADRFIGARPMAQHACEDVMHRDEHDCRH